jgi:hypothetical protein
MTQYTAVSNLTGVNASQSAQTNPAQKYFNNFLSVSLSVAPQTNDAIVAFFEEYCNNSVAAKNLAATVIFSAKAQSLDPLVILAQFQSLPKGQLDNYLTAFLNSSRVPTSILGMRYQTNTSPFVTRTILL